MESCPGRRRVELVVAVVDVRPLLAPERRVVPRRPATQPNTPLLTGPAAIAGSALRDRPLVRMRDVRELPPDEHHEHRGAREREPERGGHAPALSEHTSDAGADHQTAEHPDRAKLNDHSVFIVPRLSSIVIVTDHVLDALRQVGVTGYTAVRARTI